MKMPTFILLTSDPALEAVAHMAAAWIRYGLEVGRTPEDGARLFSRTFDSLCGVVVDLDNCKHGSAWLTAMTSTSQKIPGLAISRLNRLFLQPLARRHGADHWLSKPVTAEQFCTALQILCHENETRENPAEPETVAVEVAPARKMAVVASLTSLAPLARQVVLHKSAIERREFSVYCDDHDRCVLKENGIVNIHRVGEVSDAIDFILNLDLLHRSSLSVYNPTGLMFRILV